MKKFTINHLARAGILHNKRAYLSLSAGIFLSIFFITALCLLINGVFTAQNARIHRLVGFQDAFYMDGELTDDELYDRGYFQKGMGHVYVTAGVTGTSVHMGYYDQSASALLNRSLADGRMPEKSGEIALEQSAIERMRLTLSPGDTVTLSLTPTDGFSEERTYTVTGILNEQTQHLDVSANMQSSNRLYRWPEILTHESDAPFDSGRIVVHRVLKFKKDAYALKTLEDNNRFLFGGGAYAVMLPDGSWTGWPDPGVFLAIDSELQVTIMLISVFGVSMLIATAVGIAGATESQISRKLSEIGMLRAVGATRRQIRKIFGRESRLLALLLSPAAILTGAGFVKILSLAAPDFVVFTFAPAILIPIFFLTFVLILLSSMLPLRRASRVLPMSVLRDSELLRKSRRLTSKKRFRVPRLIAFRQFRLHPMRPVGSMLLIGAMTVVLAIAICMAGYDTDLIFETFPDYNLHSYIHSSTRFGAIESKAALSDSDIHALKTLPSVLRVDTVRTSKVNLLFDSAPSYFTPQGEFVLLPGSEQFAPEGADYENSTYFQAVKTEHEQAQRAAQTSMNLFPMDLIVVNLTDFENLSAETTGKVDISRINSGEEVIVYAPNHYFADADPDSVYAGGLRHTTWDDHATNWDYVIENDYFVPGMEINLVQMYVYEEVSSLGLANPDYETHEKTFASTRVSAVLSGRSNANLNLWSPAIITTDEGARALGLVSTFVESADIFLDKTADAELEEYLTRKITQIAMRGDLDVINHLERARKDRQQRIQATIAFFSAVIVLFSVSVGMVTGAVTRQIVSDERKIGMLRAVGADGRALARCYTGFAALSVWPGLFIGLILTLFLYIKNVLPISMFTSSFIVLLISAEILFALFAYVMSLIFIKRRVLELTKKSIVDNIREM